MELGVAAEEAGWDGVFLADHLIDPYADGPDEHHAIVDPWITMAGIAARTNNLTLGTWISPVPRRQPWQLARNLATLDQLSDGRVLLGAGIGSPEDYTRFGQAYDHQMLGQKYDEALEVITGLWRGEPFSYDGDHYTVDDAVMRPTPVQQPRIPIVFSGWWPFKASFRRGARWDGIAPNWPSMVEEMGELDVEELPDHIQEAVAQQRSHEDEVREMLEYYRGLTDDPGEIVLPYDIPGMPPELIDVCRTLGATWLLSPIHEPDASGENVEQIREGPPD